jgi:PKD repeat protein
VVNDNFFSIRWTRTAHFDSDKYIFRLAVEGGARVWLDGQILIDSWDQTAFRELETTKDVSVGNHGLRVDYRKETGNGQIHFGWAELDNPGDPPLAVINGPVRAVVGQPVTFTARNSSVAEGHRLIGFEWNFGDGATGNGIDVTHVYNSAGKSTVSLTVIDDKGLRDTTEEEIEIIATPVTPQPDQPPVAIIIAPSKARVGDVVTFDASQSVCSNPCVSFAWDFGDGSKANAIKVQHVYRRTGDYNVILTLTDNKGLQGTSNTVVRIRDAAATATPIPPTDTPVAPTVTTTAVPEIQPDASFTINPKMITRRP